MCSVKGEHSSRRGRIGQWALMATVIYIPIPIVPSIKHFIVCMILICLFPHQRQVMYKLNGRVQRPKVCRYEYSTTSAPQDPTEKTTSNILQSDLGLSTFQR
jgi:hypothetical protein